MVCACGLQATETSGAVSAVEANGAAGEDSSISFLLRDVFTPLCLELATAATPERVAEALAEPQAPIYETPYSEEIYERGDLVDPTLEPFREELSRQWVATVQEVQRTNDPDVQTTLAFKLVSITEQIEMIHDFTLPFLFSENSLRDFYNSLAEEDARAFRILLILDMRRNTKNIDTLVPKNLREGSYPSFLWTRTPHSVSNLTYGPISLPRGGYGKDLSEHMLKAVAILMFLADTYVYKNALMTQGQNSELISTYTARGRDSALLPHGRNLFDIEMDEKLAAIGPLQTLKEGILSIAQAVLLVMAEKIPGLEDPTLALEKVIEAHLPEKLARVTKMGFVGPLVQRGQFIKGLVVYKEGSLSLRREKLEAMMQLKMDAGSKRVCPVAIRPGSNEKTGVQVLSETLLDVYQLLPPMP